MLDKALWVGKAVAGAGVDTVKILSGREIEPRDKWAHGKLEVKIEVPIADITGIGREIRDRRPCVRLSPRDGSGFDFRDGSQLLIHDREGRIRPDLLVPFGFTQRLGH